MSQNPGYAICCVHGCVLGWAPIGRYQRWYTKHETSHKAPRLRFCVLRCVGVVETNAPPHRYPASFFFIWQMSFIRHRGDVSGYGRKAKRKATLRGNTIRDVRGNKNAGSRGYEFAVHQERHHLFLRFALLTAVTPGDSAFLLSHGTSRLPVLSSGSMAAIERSSSGQRLRICPGSR